MAYSVEIENVAGIRSGSTVLRPGVNTVRASNWQGKSSFIRAVRTVMGVDAPLTNGEDSGFVRLETDEETYSVELTRQGRTVLTDGEPYLESEYDRRTAELFAFLDESSAIRQAVRANENLEALLTEPLDLEDIDAQIEALKRDRQSVEADLERATDALERIPALESRIETLTAERNELRKEREELTSEGGDRDRIDSLRSDLADATSELSQVEDLIERTEQTVERTEETLSEKYRKLDSIEVPDVSDVEGEIETLEAELRSLERDVELLESIYSINRRLLQEDRLELVSDIDHGLLEDAHTCWACGQEAKRADADAQLDSIETKIDRRSETIETRRERIETLRKRQTEREQAMKRQRELQETIQALEDTLEGRKQSLDSARERRDVLEERVETLTDQVEASDDRLTEVEAELKYVDRELSSVREELETARERADGREALATRREELTDEIERLRNRKTEIRAETRRAFDEAIADVVEAFETSFESAHLTGNFDLVVARDGREVGPDSLSEGELELLGIVAALAGYEAYDVADRVPFFLLDGLGGLANENLDRLVEYLDDRVEVLVLTTYPENEAIGDWEIDPNEWSVVSNPTVGVT